MIKTINMKRFAVLCAYFILVMFNTSAQFNKSTFSLGLSPSLPLNRFYKFGVGAGLQYHLYLSEKIAFNTDLSYTTFWHEEGDFANVSYLSLKPGVNYFLTDKLYLQLNAGPNLVRRTRNVAMFLAERPVTWQGVIISGGLGYRKVKKSGYGFDVFARFNTTTGKNYIRNWIGVGIACIFPSSSKK